MFKRQIPLEEQLSLWAEFVFKQSVTIGKAVNSPIREDNNPSCMLVRPNNGDKILLYDFVYNKYYSLEKVFKILNLSLNDSLTLVATLDKPKIKYKKSNKGFNLVIEELTEEAKNYFKEYGINELLLNRAGVSSIKIWTYNDYSYAANDLAVVYTYPSGKFKMYRPYNKDYKWISTTSKSDYNYIEGDNIVVICTSLKDAMVVFSLTGHSVFSPVSESCSYTEEQILLIKSHELVFTLGDADAAGKRFNEKNVSLFDSIIIEIGSFTNIVNSYGKKCKDIAEIFRFNNKLCKQILMFINSKTNTEELSRYARVAELISSIAKEAGNGTLVSGKEFPIETEDIDYFGSVGWKTRTDNFTGASYIIYE